ncbi:MAG: SDR family oxidoreductase [Anaerolineae bacterium]
MKSIVITGSSSGIGKASAKLFAANGWKVAATMRTPKNETELSKLDNVSLYQLDVTDDQSVASAVEQIITDLGTVDVVMNNAGIGYMGPFETSKPEQVRQQFETNVFGLMNVTRAFLPHFRSNKAGLFINVSSIGGVVTFPLLSLYISSKWAVEGFTESLLFELTPFNIQVKLIEPGAVVTEFSATSIALSQNKQIEDYAEMSANYIKMIGKTGLELSTAEYLAEGIFKAATDNKKQLRYFLGPDAERIYAARKTLGDEAFVKDMAEKTISSLSSSI